MKSLPYGEILEWITCSIGRLFIVSYYFLYLPIYFCYDGLSVWFSPIKSLKNIVYLNISSYAGNIIKPNLVSESQISKIDEIATLIK